MRRVLRKLQEKKTTTNATEGDEEEADKKRNIDEEIAQIEEKIRSLEGAKEDNLLKEKRRKHESRYHMVKFFERKKITRLLEKVLREQQKQASEGKGEGRGAEELERRRKELEEDLAYVMYYPVSLKYAALFPTSRKEEREERRRQGGAESSEEEEEEKDEGEEESERSRRLSQKARALALAAWEEDKRKGGDRVSHAMAVHLKEGKGKTKGGEPDDSRKKREKRRLQSEEGGDEEEVAVAQEKKKRKTDKHEKHEKRAIQQTSQTTDQKKAQKDHRKGDGRSPEEGTDPQNDELVDEFFLSGDAAESSSVPVKQQRVDYQAIRRSVDQRKHQQHRRFSSKPSNFKKF